MEEMVAELEALCPGCKFSVEKDDLLGNVIRIIEYGRAFVVCLDEEEYNAEEWFRYEIDRRKGKPIPRLEPDEKYRVICPICGPVVIGYGGYHDQMNRPDMEWFCPLCGSTAMFDDETYEAYLGES